MNAFRTLAAAAALSLTGAAAQAATFDIAFDAADFDFDALFNELSNTAPLEISGGPLDGLLVDFFFDVTGAGGFSDIWTVDNTDANSFSLTSDDGSSLVFTGEFDDLDFVNEPIDTVVMTISGFPQSPSVIASLNAAPDSFFGPAVDVAPIPLPAAAWMLMAGVGALVAAGRRRA